MRIAFVVQRYGLEVGGGAELHCRWLAERLAHRHEVHVFTTRALDYIEWANHYPAGTSALGGVTVHRYGVRRTRSIREFASLSEVVFCQKHTREDEEAWFRSNGPYSPALVRAVEEAHDRFDLFVFYSFRYYHSYAGLPRVRDRALIVPTAEEDPAIGLAVVKELFALPRGIIYLTPEEQALVEQATGCTSVPSVVIGSGLDLPPPPAGLDFARRHGIERPFVLYVGRVDKNKGCYTLFAFFRKLLEETGLDVDLVLAGKAAIPIPGHPRIRHVGFITEEEKVAALRACRALVMPSPYESLSVVLLEAWKLGRPALVNARCMPLRGQCLRADGGLYYDGYAEFAVGLELLLERPDVGDVLGRQGQAYVEREYAWDVVEAKVEGLFARVTGATPCPSGPVRGAGSAVGDVGFPPA